MRLEDAKPGMKVRYAPEHDIDVEFNPTKYGTITSKNDRHVFVNFGGPNSTSQACRPEDLKEA